MNVIFLLSSITKNISFFGAKIFMSITTFVKNFSMLVARLVFAETTSVPETASALSFVTVNVPGASSTLKR